MPRTVDRSAQEAQLSQAVWDVLAQQGLQRLTIRAVAAAAGCTTGLVMHRFPNRRALLQHARQLLHARTRTRVDALEADAATPAEALAAVLRQGLCLDQDGLAQSVVWVGFLAAAVSDDELIAQHRTNTRAWRERITRLVRSARPNWSADHVAAVATALIAMVEGAAALASADPGAYPAGVQTAMLDTTLAALGLAET